MTIPESLIYLCRQVQVSDWGWALGAVEAAVRVRGGVVRVRVGACHGRSPDTQADSDSGADQYLRDHLVVLSCHIVLFPCVRGVVTLYNGYNTPPDWISSLRIAIRWRVTAASASATL